MTTDSQAGASPALDPLEDVRQHASRFPGTLLATHLEALCDEVTQSREQLAAYEPVEMPVLVALAVRVLQDHDMLEEAEKLKRLAVPSAPQTPKGDA